MTNKKANYKTETVWFPEDELHAKIIGFLTEHGLIRPTTTRATISLEESGNIRTVDFHNTPTDGIYDPTKNTHVDNEIDITPGLRFSSSRQVDYYNKLKDNL